MSFVDVIGSIISEAPLLARVCFTFQTGQQLSTTPSSRNSHARGLAVALQPLLQVRAQAALYERRQPPRLRLRMRIRLLRTLGKTMRTLHGATSPPMLTQS